jgi:DNA-binding beta-propeller fold protein YncE
MKTKLSAINFISAVLLLGLLGGCKTTGAGAYNGGEATRSMTVVVTTIAGSGEIGNTDGLGSAAQFQKPRNIAIDAAGNLYVADTYNHRIRKISPKGKVSTLAGGGPTGLFEGGFADGKGSAARFNGPVDIAIDPAGNLYVVDTDNHRIRKVSPKGKVSTLAGSERGFAGGKVSAARFSEPRGITIDAAGNLYVADSGNNRIRKVSPEGNVSTIAGSGKFGFADGIGRAAQFRLPAGIAIDAAGNLYVADLGNQRIRKISPAREVTTLAGGGPPQDFFTKGRFADGIGKAARFAGPVGITIDAAGSLYVADFGNHRIRKISPEGEVSTIGGKEGLVDGSGSAEQFHWPSGVAIDKAGNLYVADTFNHRICKIVIER